MRRHCLILLTASAVLLAACGGDSDKAAPGTPENPLQALPNPAPTRVPPTDETGATARSKSSSKADAKPQSQVAAQKATQAHNEAARARRAEQELAARIGSRKQKGSTVASAKRPCSLVTKAQAKAIIGAPILEPLQAPQGPTCIYQSKTGKQYVTLTVQTTDFARLKAQMRKRQDVAVSTRSAVCGTYGRPMLYVPLAGGRVLSVAGPCNVASRFAAKAVPHL